MVTCIALLIDRTADSPIPALSPREKSRDPSRQRARRLCLRIRIRATSRLVSINPRNEGKNQFSPRWRSIAACCCFTALRAECSQIKAII